MWVYISKQDLVIKNKSVIFFPLKQTCLYWTVISRLICLISLFHNIKAWNRQTPCNLQSFQCWLMFHPGRFFSSNLDFHLSYCYGILELFYLLLLGTSIMPLMYDVLFTRIKEYVTNTAVYKIYKARFRIHVHVECDVIVVVNRTFIKSPKYNHHNIPPRYT